MAAELTAETNGRERFLTATPEDLLPAAGTFARYRLTTLAIIRQSDLVARSMFLSDLMELGRRPFPEIQPITQLLPHFTPLLTRPRANSEDPPFEEIALPEMLLCYSPDLSALGAVFNPNQLMGNFISR